MDEKEKQKEKKEEKQEPAEDTGEGDKFKVTSLIERADLAAERLEKANQEMSRLLARQEEFEARRVLGGQTDAAQQIETKKPELTPTEYSKKALAGELNDEKKEE